jgi:hypothetical protein
MSAPLPLFTGVMRDGKAQWDRPLDFSRHSRTLEGERIEATLCKQKTRRSLRANAYLWLVYGYIAEDIGESTDNVHEFMKAKFLGRKTLRLVNKRHGTFEEQTVVGSTAVLNSEDFYRYVEEVRVFAGEWLGLEIPDPAPGLLVRRRKAA